MPRRAASLLTAVLLVGGLSACAGGTEIGRSGDQGFVDGSGVITVLPKGERRQPGTVAGETLEGQQVSLADYRGKVVVMNVWGSWCAPCRAEAADLAAAARELMPQGVVFLGINTRDNGKDTALAFQDKQQVPYSSIFDPGGQNLLAFRGTLSPNAIPSTVVIDAEGRVAASVIGEVTSPTTLVDIVEDVRK